MSVCYIFVTGGVCSSLGKGITAASLGRLLKCRGLKVIIQKFDPYLNMDPGTMNPYQHGEVFVTEDGAETDLDLGHYERFIDENLKETSSVSTGKVYATVLEKERNGDYNGGTVQVIPHITNEIKRRIQLAEKYEPDVIITEIGGTIGDIESLPFLEALRQFRMEVGFHNACFVHVTPIINLLTSGELKTKPTQHSVRELRSIGIQPDILVCRSEKELSQELKEKIGLFCNLSPDAVVQNLDAASLYEVPLLLHNENLDTLVCKQLKLETPDPDLKEWKRIVKRHVSPSNKVSIAIVGKYIQLHDAYISIVESLAHGGIYHDARVNIKWVDSEKIDDKNVSTLLKDIQGILIPGGFGHRGIEGKILAIQYARENKIPFLGICLGMQIAVVEFARNVLKLTDAHSTEVNAKTPHPVIDLMAEQRNMKKLGGTMRLGSYTCEMVEGSFAQKAYGKTTISERHRHRYEYNNDYLVQMQDAGLRIAGKNPKRNLVEIIEVIDHPWFVGVQFHPEFRSRPNNPHPLFAGFIGAALKQLK